jgi:NADH dehydrogenase
MRLDNVLTGPIAPELGIHPASMEAIMTDALAGRTRESYLKILRNSVHR